MIDWSKQGGKPKGEFHVHRILPTTGRPSNMCSWYVDSTDAARSMVAWWRKAEPREYPLKDEWAVLVDGEEVDRFTTRQAITG